VGDEPRPHVAPRTRRGLQFLRAWAWPYWAVSKLLFEGFDGDSGEIDAEIGGEDWIVTLRYQKGSIAPRPEDSDNIERLYEFRIGMNGHGERKANFHVRPRFADMENYDDGSEITSPCDHDQYPDEATNVHFSGSNIEPETTRYCSGKRSRRSQRTLACA